MTPPAAERRLIRVRIARKSIDSSERLGRYRWELARTWVWLTRYRRLTVHFAWRADIHYSFLTLGCCLICVNSRSAGC